MNHGYARRDGQIFLFLGCLIFLVSSAILLRVNRTPLRDFRMVYSGSRCLLHGSDPYIQGNVLRVYREEVDRQSTDSERDLLVVSRIVYLPSVFVVGLLFAALPFALAQTLWAAALAALFMVAAWMVWDLAADSSPILAGIVLCFCLGNSESIVLFGNPGSIAVSLAVIAAWSFLRHRFVPLGISCLAIGLAVKPHDTFFLWLCFLLAGGAFRSAALKSLFLSLAVSLPVTLYVFYLAPHWVPELRANLQGFFAPGSTNDPAGFHGTCAITSLQAITSYFWPDPRIYNLVAYFLSAPLIVVWAFITFRSRPTLNAAWFALATIAPLSMFAGLSPSIRRKTHPFGGSGTLPALATWRQNGLGRLNRVRVRFCIEWRSSLVLVPDGVEQAFTTADGLGRAANQFSFERPSSAYLARNGRLLSLGLCPLQHSAERKQ